jgi:hypothetical protein
MRIILIVGIITLSSTCRTDIPEQTRPAWLDALTFYASFDGQMHAEFAAGDPGLYTANDWGTIPEGTLIGAEGNASVEHAVGEGRYGDALRFHSDWDPITYFKVEDNVAYQEVDWSGTFSFWLRVNPETELEPGYSDPFIITDKNWDNASFYVDFTQDDQPRHFRFAAFADKPVWNPDHVPWEEIAVEDRPMIDLAEHPFAQGEWTHIVLTFEGFNTGQPSGRMTGYLNGVRAGVLEGRLQTMSWDLSRTGMAMGRHFQGLFDELAVFNQALGTEEVRQLYETHLRELVQ